MKIKQRLFTQLNMMARCDTKLVLMWDAHAPTYDPGQKLSSLHDHCQADVSTPLTPTLFKVMRKVTLQNGNLQYQVLSPLINENKYEVKLRKWY